MKLWLISQSANDGYDTYDSAVVAAETSDDARHIYPRNNYYQYNWNGDAWFYETPNGERRRDNGREWTDPANVTVEEIGTTDRAAGTVILASFDAG